MAETRFMTINMGPQHPATHGVLRLVLELDGEIVVKPIYTCILKSLETGNHVGVLGDIYTAEHSGEITGTYLCCASAEADMMCELYIHAPPFTIGLARAEEKNGQKTRNAGLRRHAQEKPRRLTNFREEPAPLPAVRRRNGMHRPVHL